MMETKTIPFHSLKELQLHLETNYNHSTKRSELSRDIYLLSDQTTDGEVKKNIIAEGLTFDFYFDEGKTKPRHTSTNDAGDLFEYPSYKEFTDDQLEYIKGRLSTSSNDYLINRYSQLLWNGPSKIKHSTQAKLSVDSCLRIIASFELKNHKDSGWEALKFLKNGLYNAVQIKYRVEDFKSILKNWLFGKIYPHDTKKYIIDLMLEISSVFKNKDFDGILDLILDIAKQHAKVKTDYFQIKDILLTGLHVARKLKTDTSIWNEHIGDAIVKMAEYRMDDESRMIPLTFYKEAISYYKKAHHSKKVKKTEKIYADLKSQLKLSKIEIPMDDEASKKLAEYMDARVEALLGLKPQQIISYLLEGNDIFPSSDLLEKMVKDSSVSFLDFVTTVKFDINNNISNSENSNSNPPKEKLFNAYNIYIRSCLLPYLHRIFVEGIKRGKISFESVANYFHENTWLGQEFTDPESSRKYKWLYLIAPSLQEYFFAMESALRSKRPTLNLVLSIDSLTLKFEGVLRDFARLIGLSTTTLGKNDILREKYIEELLQEEEIRNFFDDNDRIFFEYLFTAKDGMNLRNNIAHSFFRFENYTLHYMHLLICAFLRIGKYKMEQNTND